MKRIGLVFLLTFFLQVPLLKAQQEIVDFLNSSTTEAVADANTLTENFLAPVLEGFGQGLNGGWYNTARTHKSGGIEFLISVNAVFIPDSKQFFTFSNSDYSTIRLADASLANAPSPTILGPAIDGPNLEFYDPGSGVATGPLAAYQGAGLKDEIGYNAIPTPVMQIGVGIVKNTDLKLRFVPSISFGTDNKSALSFFGVGVMHDFKQWIPGIKQLPFKLSGLAAYSKLSANADASGELPGSGQELDFNVTAFTLQVIISKKFSVVDFYGAVGYNSVSSNIDLLGSYELDPGVVVIDPVRLKFADAGARGTIGMRLKLGFFQLYGDYTLSNYNVLNAGLGFTFGEHKDKSE